MTSSQTNKSNRLWTCLITLLLMPIGLLTVRAADTQGAGGGATITQIIASLQSAHRQVSQPLDLDEVIARVGPDAQKLNLWVRQQIAYEPYSGVMKGATGALISRRANSADKALLLCELLGRAGFKAQLVKSVWSDAKAPGIALPPMPSDEPDSKQVEEFAKLANLSVETIQSMLKASSPERQQFQEQLWSRAVRDREQIASLLDSRSVPAPDQAAIPIEASRWWVRTSSDVLDPTSDSAPPAGSETAFDPDKIPDDQSHRITVRMLIAPKTGESVCVLEVPLKSCEVFGRTIVVGATSLDVTNKLQAVSRPDTRAYFDVLESAKEFQPSLMVLGPSGTQRKVIPGTAFDLSGNTIASVGGRTASVGKLGGAAGGMFGGLSEQEPETEKPKPQLADAWLEIELSAPGATTPVKIRRDILAHVAETYAAKQHVLDLLAVREIMVLPEEITGDYATAQTLAHSAAWAQFLVTHPKKQFDSRQFLSILAERPHLNEKLLSFALARRAALAQLCSGNMAQQLGTTAYVHERPTLVSHLNRFIDDDKGTRAARRLDIIDNAVVPIGVGSGKDWHRNFGLACGAMDTALEHLLMWGTANASAALDQSRFSDNPPVVISGKLPEHLTLDPDARATIEPQLAQAAFVYLPGAKPMWYRVNLTDGVTLGMVEGGGGQEESEYAEMVEIYVQLYEMLEFYGELGRCLGEAISAPLAGEADAHKVLESCFVGMCAKAPWAAAGVAGVEASWTNLIITQTINQTFKKFCEKIWEHLGPGEGHGEGH